MGSHSINPEIGVACDRATYDKCLSNLERCFGKVTVLPPVTSGWYGYWIVDDQRCVHGKRLIYIDRFKKYTVNCYVTQSAEKDHPTEWERFVRLGRWMY